MDFLNTKVDVAEGTVLDVSVLLGKLSLEAIGVIGFGHSFHAFGDGTDEFAHVLESYSYVSAGVFGLRDQLLISP